MKSATEVRNDYVDDNNYCHIDAYFDENDNSEGKTVAIVDMDSGKVFFIDEMYRSDRLVQEAVVEITMLIQERKMVRLTFTSKYFAEKAAEVIGRTHDGTDNDADPEFWDFNQVDLLSNLPDVLRFLGTCKENTYYFSTEEN